MSATAEVARLKRDVTSLEEEIAVSTGARTKSPLSSADRRALRAELQGLIQKLDELHSRLAG
jgi:hypothetical protein